MGHAHGHVCGGHSIGAVGFGLVSSDAKQSTCYEQEHWGLAPFEFPTEGTDVSLDAVRSVASGLGFSGLSSSVNVQVGCS